MSGSPERIDAVVRAMLDDQRPQGFNATSEEVEALRMAAQLSAARPGASEPDAGFVESLAGRLRAAATSTDFPGSVASSADADILFAPGRPLPLRPARRAFLRAAGLAAAAAAGVIGDRTVEHYRNGSPEPDGTGTGVALVPAGAVWRDVALLADVRSAGPVRFRAGAVEGVVALAPGGGVMAVSAVCTHMGCVLDVASATRLRCPCHGAQFNVDGSPAANAYPIAALPTLQSRINGDRVQVLA